MRAAVAESERRAPAGRGNLRLNAHSKQARYCFSTVTRRRTMSYTQLVSLALAAELVLLGVSFAVS